MTQSFDFSSFFAWQTVVFCLALFAITYCIRKLIEILWKGALKDDTVASKLYSELFLFLLPLALGLIIAMFAKKYPWPVQVGVSYSSRGLYGLVCGMFSGVVYNRIRSLIKATANGSNGGQTVVPDPGPVQDPSEKEEGPHKDPPAA